MWNNFRPFGQNVAFLAHVQAKTQIEQQYAEQYQNHVCVFQRQIRHIVAVFIKYVIVKCPKLTIFDTNQNV